MTSLTAFTQANPLDHRKKNEMSDLLGSSAGILAAHQPLVVPMLLRLSQFRLNSYVVLVLSKQKGCTLVFKTDPLQNVEVSSTFDSIAVIQNFIQREIEEQLREMFREDLPSIIHRLSQRWVAGQTKVEAPYLDPSVPAPLPRAHSSPWTNAPHSQRSPSTSSSSKRGRRNVTEPLSSAGVLPVSAFGLQPGLHPPSAYGRPTSSPSVPRSSTSVPGSSAPPSSYNPPSDHVASTPSGTKTPLSSDFPFNPQSSLPEIENFDPTYGMRPEGLPQRSGYSGLGKLFEASRGLHELAVSPPGGIHGGVDAGIDGESAYSMVDLDDEGEDEDGAPDVVVAETFSPHIELDDEIDVDDRLRAKPNFVDLETIPAVGGGFVTRPRVYQSPSSSDPAVSPSSQDHGHVYRDRNVPRLSRVRSEGPKKIRRSRRHRTMVPLHRDRGIGMDTATDAGLPSYNPYFGDNIYHSRSSTHANPDWDDGYGMSSSHSKRFRRATASTSRSIPVETSAGASVSRDSSTDRQRSISRSPPTVDASHYGSPSHHPHRRRHLEDSHSDDPERDTGNYAHMNAESHQGHQRNSSRGIILRNQSVSQLSALSRSNQTLSPYTRSFSHFTVRSGPPKPFVSNTTPFTLAAKAGPRKARRKRTYRWGDGDSANVRNVTSDHCFGNGLGGRDEVDGPDGRWSYSPSLPSDISDEDVEHYFRTRRPSEVHSPVRVP